jgi:uncharacterized protein (DUF1697 family)
MIKYVALLRGINVGGKKLIKMEDLSRVFARSGFKNVRTFIQSGNVIFDAAQTNSDVLARKIEKKLLESFGHEVTVIVITIAELEDILKRNPFKKIKPGTDVMMFVTFLSTEPNSRPKLPLISSTENLEVFAIKGRAAFILARRKKNGASGFPNNFIEKQLGVSATTRNWTTVSKIVALAKSGQ